MGIEIGIGTAVMSFFGSTAAAGAITSGVALTGGMAIAAGVIGGAIIGATIGGLTALVTGGDIGKGLLFGAVGGAVAGGVSGYFQGAGGVDAAMNVGAQGADGMAVSGYGQGLPTSALSKGAEETIKQGASSTFMEKAGAAAIGGGVEGAFKLGSGILGGIGTEKAQESEQAFLAAEKEKDRQHAKEMQALATAGGGTELPYNPWKEELAERKRQFDVTMEQRKYEYEGPRKDAEAKRQRAGQTIIEARKMRRGNITMSPNDKPFKVPQLDAHGTIVQEEIPNG